MAKNLNKDIIFEKIILPGVINGSLFDWEDTEIPIVGIKGFGTKHERNDKKSIWIHGVILSPNVVHNNSCSSRSYIEGIVTCDGVARFLESVSNFLAHEGSCFDYNLRMKDSLKNYFPEFEGEVFSRKCYERNAPKKAGQVYLSMNSSWPNREEGGAERVCSLPRYRRNRVVGDYVPTFWKTFLGEIEEKGFDHPYMPQTEKLTKERKSKEEIKMESLNPKNNSDDLPF